MAEVRKYDAFISYRHSELDKFVATTLQRKLEAFTLPKGVSSKTKKKRIERVFRDQDELPLSSNLSEPIHLALNNTDFLIVICTPRLPESKWCEEEISTFIKLYGREKILAVLAEGEPSESFPPLLTGEDYEETLPDGTKVTKHRSFEPLAADVRGKNNKEVRKKLDDAVLRIAASIFELNYDDLKQRHRERKIRRMFSVISSVAAAFMIFSAVCVGLMITIMNQSNMIMEQNTEIKEQSNEISQKNALINQQYEEAAKNLSKLTAGNCHELLNKGRKKDALYMLRQVIPNSSTDTSIPYTPEAEGALADALEVYKPVNSLKIESTYDSDYEIQSVSFSPDKSRILTIDTGNNFTIFDVQTGNILFSKQCVSNSFDPDKKAVFCSNDYVIISEEDGIHKYSINDSKGILLDSPKNNGEALNGVIVRPNNRVADYTNFVVTNSEDVYLLDSTGKCLFTFPLSDYSSLPSTSTLNSFSVSNDGKYIAFDLCNVSDNKSTILAFDSETNEIILNKSYNTLTISNVFFYNHTLLYCVGGSGLLIPEAVDDNNYSCFSFDCEAKKENWKSRINDYVDKIQISDINKYIYLANSSSVITLNLETGNIITNTSLSEEITDIYALTNNDGIFVAAQSGNNAIYSCETNVFVLNRPVISYNDVIKDINHTYVSSYGFFILYNNANYITRYVEGVSNSFTEYGKAEEGLVEYNASKELFICSEAQGSYSVKSSKTKETILSLDNVQKCMFVGDGSQYVLYKSGTNSNMYLYDFTNDKTFSLEEMQFRSYSPNRKYAYSRDYKNHCLIYDLESMKVTCECDFPEDLDPQEYEISPIDDTHLLFKSANYRCVEIYSMENGSLKKIFAKYLGKFDYLITCSTKYCFCISYSTGMVEFYDYSSGSVELISTIFNLSNLNYNAEFNYYENKNIYVLSSSSMSYILNKDFCSLATIYMKIDYKPEENLITYKDINDRIWAAPFYTYDELVKRADDELSGYCPPIRILKEYNITPR